MSVVISTADLASTGGGGGVELSVDSGVSRRPPWKDGEQDIQPIRERPLACEFLLVVAYDGRS